MIQCCFGGWFLEREELSAVYWCIVSIGSIGTTQVYSVSAFQVLHSRVDSWHYLLTLDDAGNAS
jgi:hypothetical protein